MKLKDYLVGRRIVLYSRLPPADVAERINAAAHSTFASSVSGVVGWSHLGRLSLHWKIPFLTNGFQPTFWGRMREHDGGSLIDARFGAPFHLNVVYAGWLVMTLFMLFHAAAGSAMLMQGRVHGMPVPVVALLFVSAPFAAHFIFNRNADKNYERILAFLAAEAQLAPHPPGNDRRRAS